MKVYQYNSPLVPDQAVRHGCRAVAQGRNFILLLSIPPPADILHPTPHGCHHQQGYHAYNLQQNIKQILHGQYEVDKTLQKPIYV